MKVSLFPLQVGVVVCVSAVALPGCGPHVAVVPVQGKVTLNGQPVTSGQVSYLAADKESKAGPATGPIESDGSYTIHTAGKEGAPPGKYKVTVTPTMVPMEGATKKPSLPFDQKYGDPRKTPLTVEVVASPAPGAYDLKLTK
jgi:hypothetical protein